MRRNVARMCSEAADLHVLPYRTEIPYVAALSYTAVNVTKSANTDIFQYYFVADPHVLLKMARASAA